MVLVSSPLVPLPVPTAMRWTSGQGPSKGGARVQTRSAPRHQAARTELWTAGTAGGAPQLRTGPRGRCAYHCASYSPAPPLTGRANGKSAFDGGGPVGSLRPGHGSGARADPWQCQGANVHARGRDTREGSSNGPFGYTMSESAGGVRIWGTHVCSQEPSRWAGLRQEPERPWDPALRAGRCPR